MRTPNTFTSPKLHDKVVQELITSLSSLTYIDNFYPIVHLGYGDDDETYPCVYMNDGTFDNYMVFPDNRVRAFIFFEMEDGFVSDMAEDGQCEYEFNLVFWGNLQRINTIKSYDYTSEIINDIVTILGSKDAREIYYTTEVDEIFDRYSAYSEGKRQTLLRPNTGFKITFKINGDSICWNDSSPIGSDMINTEIDQGVATLVADVEKTIDLSITFSSNGYTVDGRAYDANGNVVFPTLVSRTTTEFVVKANKDCTYDWTAILKL